MARFGAHVEHAAHVRDAGRVEAQRLVEGRRAAEHEVHVRDAGRVEAQRLVEGLRALPSRKGGVQCWERCAGRKAGERTINMPFMFVTRDVLKFTGWLKAAVRCRVESRACDEGRGVQAGTRGS